MRPFTFNMIARRAWMVCLAAVAALAALCGWPLLASADSSTTTAVAGDQTVETSLDSNGAGSAEAFPFTSQQTGNTVSIAVYVDSHNKATKLIAGLYTSSNGQPGSRIASGSLSSPKAGAWNTVPVAAASVTSGAKYWLAILGEGGMLYFRDGSGGSCSSQSSASSSLSGLPSTWSGGAWWNSCPVSAYVSLSGGVSAPVSSAAPVVTGTSTVGQTLWTSTGSWSNSPTSYTYAWEDCDSSGASCTLISGATASGYQLGSGDVGHTIRAIVTAGNGGGSGTATSAQTSVVTAALPAAPVNTAAPVVSGSAVQGQTLSSTAGSWNNSPTSYHYQWDDCDSAGAGCTEITGATSSTYVLAAGDVADTIRVAVTATNAGGSATRSSAQTAVVTAPITPPPANTAPPAVSGTPQQGQSLTVTKGTWTGSPTAYAYRWQDCGSSGTGCADIAGATSTSYGVQTSDVGHTVRAVVTATNSGGSDSASSAATAVVTSSGGGGGGASGSLPSGVTLQAIDGGTSYYSQFSNDTGWDSPSFYPISVFNQSLGYNGGNFDSTQITAYKNEGVNGFVGLYNGYNQSLLDAIKSNNMWAIDGPLAPSYAGSTMNGYVWFDEADGNDRCGDMPSATVLGEKVPCTATSDGRTPSTAIAQATADLHGAHGAGDKTRFVYGQYTKPVARNEGMTPAEASTYVNAVDVISFDDYLISDGWESDHNLWEQADLVQNVRAEGSYKHPVMPFIEAGEPFTSDQWSKITPTPAMSVAEAWNGIIGGARGIQWFDHDFGGSSGGYADSGDDLIDPNPVFASLQAAVKSFNHEVTALAPVINSPFANGYVTNTGALNVMAKYDSSSNDFYVFAAPRSNASQNITFTVAGGYSGPVTVYGENRTLTATNGRFTDTFANQTAVHIYVVPNS